MRPPETGRSRRRGPGMLFPFRRRRSGGGIQTRLMRRFFALVAGLPLTACLSFAALDPATIESPRPNGWVTDKADLLSPAAEAEINTVADAVHQRDGAELAIVTVRTVAGADPRGFATDLFNRWRIGAAGRNNGLLLFVAIDDRAAEIILGDGIDSDAEVAASDRIMQTQIVPRFRQGDPEGAILAGVRACAGQFFPAARPAPNPESTAVERPADPSRPATSTRRDASGVTPSRKRSVGVLGPVAGIGVLGGIGTVVWIVARAVGRRRARKCRGCGREMSRLDEAADDAHLSAAERVEESIGSVDYDVWLCPWCSAVEKVRYGRWFTRFARCPKCGAVTSSKVSTTLVSATTMSGGLVRVDESCANCDYRQSHTRSTPRISTSSGSSHRSSSGFGGGRSSGRGSSGRW
jgi:uncharacterized protein